MCACWRMNVEIMATAEQVHEALQQLKAQGHVLPRWRRSCESNQPELRQLSKRSALIQTLGAMRTDRRGAMVDTKGIGQLFLLKGTADQDFGEWTHKVGTLMLTKFGDQILTAPTWAARQRKIVVKTCVDRFVAWNTVFGDRPTKTNRSTTLMTLLGSSMPTLSLSQPTHPTELFGSLEKEMAWKPEVDCTVSTTPRRP